MSKRSKVPKYIKKGIGKCPAGRGEQPMTFKRRKGRSKRVDTGKKLNDKHNTPNLK